MVENTDKKILILSMEGGGVRGILQAEFLRLLEGASKQMVPEIFDFFNGVSIGEIHGLSLSLIVNTMLANY